LSTLDPATHADPGRQAAPGLLGLAERGWLPDALIRTGIRRLCAARLRRERAGGVEAQDRQLANMLAALRASPLAIETGAANAQHYELPAAFFERCLGPRLKYSCAYYQSGRETLAEAEEAMLRLYCERARLADGQEILELGCGWGSLTLWMAEHYRHARIFAVSNSQGQRAYIEHQCRVRALSNVNVMTCDVNRLEMPTGRFDRCVSIEMFEHLRNYETLLARIASWLAVDGKLFVHIFAHRLLLYPFETQVDGADDWMGLHFFTGGLMPSVDTLLWFQRDLVLEQRWLTPGTHYQRTANHWLANQDANHEAVRSLLAVHYGTESAALRAQRWRMFWMACAETFGYARGSEWLVAHYLFGRR
jgi:cyclopropane-fatty-acyl-phospholipid synthase